MDMLVLVALCFVELVLTVFAIIIFHSGIRERLNRSFLLFLLGFIIWSLLNYFSNIVEIGPQWLLFINRLLFASSLLMFYLMAYFIAVITERKHFNILLKILALITVVAIIFSLTPLVVKDVLANGIVSIGVSFGLVAPAYFLVILIIAIFVIAGLVSGMGKANSRRVRSSSRILLFTIGSSVIAMAVTNVLIPLIFNNFDFSIFGMLFGALVTGGVGYAVVRHGLFDIKLAAVRTVTYALSLIVLAVAYFGLTYFLPIVLFRNDTRLSVGNNSVGIILTILLAFIFQPVKRFFDKITNRIFYKDNYNTDNFFEKLNKILGFTTDLRALLQHTATEIGTTLKGEQAFFYIKVDDNHFVSAGTVGHKQLPKADIKQLDNFVESKNGVIIASLLEDNDSVKRLMISHRIELILPLVQEKDVIGYLCLGDHLTSNYTSRDIKVLNTISNELIIAIQNALAVQEIRDFSTTLQQRIANATRELRASNAQLRHLDKAKDEFLSMASHQLRTPLTSVKGYISMILDGDAGKVSKDQEHLLGEAFNNSERMVGLINDFLSISRIQTGRFVIEKTPIDLSMVVEQEVNSLRANAAARQMELVYERPEDLPIMDIDEGKIRQVIMNFIDNAIYYSHPNTKININLSVQKGEILFTVKDTGIGVPKAECDQLFTKFFRASNAKKTRPDGSGVGLFLAKKVVDDHDGKIIFESTEGKGSTFGFRLPTRLLT